MANDNWRPSAEHGWRAVNTSERNEESLFGGFRRATIDQSENHQYRYQGNFGDSVNGTIAGRSELETYGIRLGAQTQWTTRWGLGLFGRLAGSVLRLAYGW